MFTFSRLSAQNGVPLVSRLAINTTTDDLNGFVLTCSDLETSKSMVTIIQVMSPIPG
jgi:hypothetical protein